MFQVEKSFGLSIMINPFNPSIHEAEPCRSLSSGSQVLGQPILGCEGVGKEKADDNIREQAVHVLAPANRNRSQPLQVSSYGFRRDYWDN